MSLDRGLRRAVRAVVREATVDVLEPTLRALRDAATALAIGATGNGAEYLSTEEAARHAGVRAATVRAWVRHRKLRGYRAGRLLKVRVRDLDAFLAGNLQRGAR